MSDLTIMTEMKMYELGNVIDDLLSLAHSETGRNVMLHGVSDLRDAERKLRELQLELPVLEEAAE